MSFVELSTLLFLENTKECLHQKGIFLLVKFSCHIETPISDKTKI